MLDQTVQYLESHRKIVFEYDVSELVDVATNVWTSLKETTQKVYSKTLLSPQVIFDGEEGESLDFNWVVLRFKKENELLELVSFKDRSGVSFLYRNNVTKKSETHWYESGTPLSDWFIEKLLLFTE